MPNRRTAFERFRQGDASSTREHGGLGLGLGIVRYIVELHGGRVFASSGGENAGSTFEVRLPMRLNAAPNPSAPLASSARGGSFGSRSIWTRSSS